MPSLKRVSGQVSAEHLCHPGLGLVAALQHGLHLGHVPDHGHGGVAHSRLSPG